jgi:hypothetical protein
VKWRSHEEAPVHQQVRTSTTKSGSGSRGPGAAYDDSGSLVDILTILAEAGVNMQSAGGRDLDEGGEFVFSVHHDGEGDDGAREAAKLLKDAGYDARVARAHPCAVADRPGGLLGCIKDVEASDGPVYEIFVGTPDANGDITVQLTTRASVKGGEAAV